MVLFDQQTGEHQIRESGLKPPNLAKYNFNADRIAELMKEYGAMLPSKDVYCTPDPKVINFLKYVPSN